MVADPEGARLQTLGLVAHDLNNPLAAIRILAEMLASDLSGEPEAQRDARDVLEAADTASALIEGLSALVTLGQHPVAVGSDVVDLVALARAVVGRACFAPYVDVQPCASPLRVRANTSAVHQAVSDVVFNARRLSLEGHRVIVRLEAPATIVCLSSGITVAPDLRACLLEPFGAVEARERRTPVAAVGLAYAARVMEAHGGLIELSGGEGTFEVRLIFRSA